MKKSLIFMLVPAVLLSVAVAAYFLVSNKAEAKPGKLTVSWEEILEQNTSDWPDNSRKAIDAMKKKYGEPNEMTATMVVWHNSGPWKRTIVYKEEVDHNFPMPHKDVMEQFINYKVPTDKFDELAVYDGSVVCYRTNGEMSARCDKEDMNFLALNLANDVVTGKKDVKAARDFYATIAVAYMKGNKQPYTQKFQFEVPKTGTEDEDNVSDNIEIKEMMKAMKEKMKERASDGY